ncbi:MAG: nucleoside/nucleotide kinase family protein [Clostridia bacterium]|nr:nucleoside/nucleotide kinase family protein [Clostridia bacterium]
MKRIENAGRTIEAEFSDEDARNIFLPLLRRFTHMRRAKGRRLLVMLAGPPASGKSTLAALLKALAEDTDGVIAPTVLGMDGFHWPQAYLRAHAVMRNGELIPMTRVKGSPVSYDLQGLRQAVARVAAGEICLWPAYDRRIHDPVPDAIRVDGEIVLLEGNYLLLDEDGWRDLRAFADYTISVDADHALLMERVIARHMAGGLTREEAVQKAEENDRANMRLCREKCLPADLALRIRTDGGYEADITERVK